MRQIGTHKIFVGTKEEYDEAVGRGMAIVCAVNRAKEGVTHQSVVGWSGRGCDKDNPYYLYKREPKAIYLNLIDGVDPLYVPTELINAALQFIDDQLEHGNTVFIYCSLGESRAPSLALMYLLHKDLIVKSRAAFNEFKDNYYPEYEPKPGMFYYIKNRWNL